LPLAGSAASAVMWLSIEAPAPYAHALLGAPECLGGGWAGDNGEAGVLAEVEAVPDEAGADDGGVLAEVEADVDVVAVADVVGVEAGEVVVDVV
jgi:hypothetical protein